MQRKRYEPRSIEARRRGAAVTGVRASSESQVGPHRWRARELVVCEALSAPGYAVVANRERCPLDKPRWSTGFDGSFGSDETKVLGMIHGFVQQHRDVVVVERVDDVAAVALSGDKPHRSQ